MKRELIKKVFFILTMIVYLAVPLQMIYSYQVTLNTGNVHRFRPIPIDPYDAFRGKYITLNFTFRQIDFDTSKVEFEQGENVYLKLGKDSLGFAEFTEALKEAPKEGDYIKSTVGWTYVDTVGHMTVSLPFERYYLPEGMAAEAETAYFQNLGFNNPGSLDTTVYVDVRVKNGKAVIEELYFQGTPVKDYIRKVREENLQK